MKSITMKVEGMHCDGCADTLQALLETETGVQAVTVSHESGEARILFDPDRTTIDRLTTIAQRPGHRVTAWQES